MIPRHQRDISRLLALVKAHALLNFNHRERRGDDIVAEDEDVDAGFKLYKEISEANELGLSPELYDIYMKFKLYIERYSSKIDFLGITVADYQSFYQENYYRKVNYDTARETLRTLANMGLLTEDFDPNDRRTRRYLLPGCARNARKYTVRKYIVSVFYGNFIEAQNRSWNSSIRIRRLRI